MSQSKSTKRFDDLTLDPKKYYFFFPLHHGDTFRGIGFIRCFEREVNAKVICLIRPSQEFIMRLFGIDEYELIDYDYEETPTFWNKIAALSDLCPRPRRGGVFVAHPFTDVHREFQSLNKFQHSMQRYASMYQLNSPITNIFSRPNGDNIFVREAFQEKLSSIAPLNELVLLSPASLSWNEMLGKDMEVMKFWEKEAALWSQQGYKVLVSSIKPIYIKGTTWIDMTMEEAVWLGIHCRHVTTIRSGYADIISFLCKDLKVIYISHEQYIATNFYDPFMLEIDEIILPGNEIQDENGISLSLSSDMKNLNYLKREYKYARLFSHIAVGGARKKYKKKKKELKTRILEAEKMQRVLGK